MANEKIKIDVEVQGSKSVESAADSVQRLNSEAEKTKDSFSELGSESSIFSEIKSKVGGAVDGVKKFAGAFKTVKGAIAATGIGLLLIAVTTLISYFKTTEGGARALSIATEAMGIIIGKVAGFAVDLGKKAVEAFSSPKQLVMDLADAIKTNITNRISGLIELFPKLGEAIALTFQGKFKEAGKVAVDAAAKLTLGVDGITDKVLALKDKAVEVFEEIVVEVEKAVDAATKFVDAQEGLRKAINSLIIANANLNKELEEQQKIGEDTTRGYDERRIALEKAGEAQIKLSQNLAKQAGLEESLLRLQMSNTADIETRRGIEGQLAEQIATRIDAESALLQTQLDVSQVIKELDIEEMERKASIANLIRESTIDNSLSKYEAAQVQLKVDEEAALLELTLLKATEEEKSLVRAGFAKQSLDVEAERLEEVAALKLEETRKEEELLRESNEYKKDLQRGFERSKVEGFELALLNAQNSYDDDLISFRKSLEDKVLTEEEFDAINLQRREEFNASVAEINKASADSEKAAQQTLNQQKLQGVSDILSATASLAELFAGKGEKQARKAFKVQKAAQIAQVAIQTVQSATSAFSSLAAIPVVGVPLGIAAAAAATASGLLNIGKIKATTFDGGGGSTGGSTPVPQTISTPEAAPTPPSLSLYGQEIGTSNEAANKQELGQNQQQNNFRAYVVESDITNTQNTLNKYKTRSEIG